MPKNPESILLCVLGLMISCSCKPGTPRARGQLPQQAYVWQRAWTKNVADAVTDHSSAFDSLVVLGAEVSWKNKKLEIARANLDYIALASAKSKVGIALRIGPFPGPFSKSDATVAALSELAKALVDGCRTNSIPVSELQIDFDCAASKLDQYALWIAAIREKSGPIPLTITALPSWLKKDSFKLLADAVDGFVLQVHSLERPKNPESPFTLCDPVAAGKAVERAARFRRPFRVALPTYGYIVAFNRKKEFVGLSADGPERIWPTGAILKETRADPEAMARLVREWTVDRPSMLGAIIWYRLPVSGDNLNWTWPTLSAVMEGRNPRPHVLPQIQHPSVGLIELSLTNSGDLGAHSLPGIALEWDQGRCIAGDGLGGFQLDTRDGRAAYLTGRAARELKPGEARKIGWLRFDQANPAVQVRTF